MHELSAAEIKAAKARGAATVIIPKVIEVPGLQSLVDQLSSMIVANQRAQVVVLAALNELTDVIKNKELKGTDVTKLTAAVSQLKTEHCEPCDYQIDFERDNKGSMKTGVRFSVVK